jgi:hypothetical protein
MRRLRRLRLRWLGSLYMAMATWLVLGRGYTSGSGSFCRTDGGDCGKGRQQEYRRQN